MADYVTRIRTAEGDKQIDYNALANLPPNVTDVTNTVISPNADYAEVGEWADGNPANEDRLCYFVAVAEVGDNTIKIRKATSADDVRGVTVYNPAFSGNASGYKYGEDGELYPQYNYVGVMGIVKIIDNGKCEVGGRCMPGDDGTAIPSSNNMGYAVLERVDDTHVLIAVEPGADMIQRVKTDVKTIQTQLEIGVAPPIVLSAEGEQITITDSAKRGFQGLKIYGKTTQNGTPSPDAPVPLESVGANGTVVTTVGGANLFDKSKINVTYCTPTETGFKFINNNVQGSPTTLGALKEIAPQIKAGDIITMNCSTVNGTPIMYLSGSKRDLYRVNPMNILEADLNGEVFVYGDANVVCEYKDVIFTKTANAQYQTYSFQQLITTTPNGLCSIPNTDVRDEVDFERGVLIKRTGLDDLGTLYWSYQADTQRFVATISNIRDVGGSAKADLMCERYESTIVEKNNATFHYANRVYIQDLRYTDATTFKSAMQGVMLLYELATPTETPLSAEEIEAYKKLHTNYPTTVITSEGYANVKYVADTKNYIDNKFALLATQIVNNA